MKLSLLTPTGMRPEALALCELWVSRQTLAKNPDYQKNEVEWVIIDDTPEDEKRFEPRIQMAQTVLPEPRWEPGKNTQARNLLAGLEKCKGDLIAIVEDDDHYKPDYLEALISQMGDNYEIVGEGGALYYSLPSRKWKRYHNYGHAGLCQTIFRRSLIPLLVEAIENHKKTPPGKIANDWFIDVGFWRLVHERKVPCFLYPRARRVTGVKGLPGRAGIGSGHVTEGELGWTSDRNLAAFQRILGADAKLYEPYLGEKKDYA